MKKLLLATILVGCGSDGPPPTPDGPDNSTLTYDQCDGDAQSFVRQAFLALDGRRPKSQAEVQVYVDLYESAKARGDDPVEITARAIMNRPEFAERWVDAVMDALHVQRLDVQTEASCWDEAARGTVTPALAMAIRDKAATTSADGQIWTMLDLARSSIALDDLSPIYRGQLFSLVAHPIPAANVDAREAELARRADFGTTFDSSFINRDIVCLGCHNSEASVTDSDDPAFDRHFPVPGNPERLVYGAATGVEIERAHAVFRLRGFFDNGNTRPWGWARQCGEFAAPSLVQPDTLTGVDAKLGNITGNRATVFDVEASLSRGFAALRAGAPTADLTDPDVALAWLVTLKITEDVWTHATGTRLTIANYFPRNQASADLLYSLASKFAASGFSLKALLVAIVASDFFNRQPPELGCGPSPYTYPNVFDPWVIADADEARRLNGPGDAVTAIDARTLLGVTSAALEWSAPPGASRFPDYGEPGCETESCSGAMQSCNVGFCCTTAAACQAGGLLPRDELPFLRGIGVFLRNSERGFRGLDFQARLSWEDRHGACARPGWVAQDFIDRLVAAAAADTTATARDVVAALKDRLVGEPAIAEGAEADVLAQILGTSLDNPAVDVTADELRRVCGALVESPQFLLQGIAGRGGDLPKLTPADVGYDAVCADLAATGIGVTGRVVACGTGKAELVDARIAPAPIPRAPADRTLTPNRAGKPAHRRPAPLR